MDYRHPSQRAQGALRTDCCYVSLTAFRPPHRHRCAHLHRSPPTDCLRWPTLISVGRRWSSISAEAKPAHLH
jgi:hypothetical protein